MRHYQRLAQTGDIFYQTVRPYQKNNYLFELPDEDYVFSTGYAQLRPNGDARFLFAQLQKYSFVKIVLDNCTGTSYPAINAKDLAEIEIGFPSNIEEQRAIGSFLFELDNLITLHQREPSIDPKEGDSNVVSIQLRRAVLRLLQEVGCNIQRGGHQKSNHAEIPINLRLARSLDSQFKSSEPQSRRISTAS